MADAPPRGAAGAEYFRAFPKAGGTQERRGRERPRPEPGSCVDGTEGEGRPDVSGAAISCFSAVFLSFGWWLLLCFAFQVHWGPGGVDSGPGTRRPAARSLAPARSALPEPAASRLSDRPPPPRPTERPRCRPSSVWWWETGECTTVSGATEGVSSAAPWGGGRHSGPRRPEKPRAGVERAPAFLGGAGLPPSQAWFRLLVGGGPGRAGRREK